MSIVSAKIDSWTVRGVKHVKTAPQRDVEQDGEEPVFAFDGVAPVFIQGKKIMLPSNNSSNHPLDYVPLKSTQEFSHVEGASLFNACVPEVMPRLDIPSNMPPASVDALLHAVYPQFATPLDFEAGIRGSKRMMKLDDVNEPSRNMYRPNASNVRGSYINPSVNYNVGSDELKSLMRRWI
jgi:hypothetical protein